MCKPNTYCDKADLNNCAPYPRANCTDKPDGSGFECICNDGYQGDGRKCEATSICERQRPCTDVTNTRCVDDKKEPGSKYKCVCLDGHARQLKDKDNNRAPCYPPGPMVNNCTSCSPNTENCVEVEGDDSKLLRTCVCKPGYNKGLNGLCTAKNGCFARKTSSDIRPTSIIPQVPHLDGGLPYKCGVKKGWSGNGTLGTCKDIIECDANPCKGDGRVCHNTIGSFKVHA
ncbi:hypothetical protein PFISCL1PPCAC_12830 [Pristionchus fissidentatus]|uniref:EGF-like domain-containing protein n=1 Tax=Pristionchus fissidentatus TaxID=1538716 RepID=A0AAV5VT47_9BILA|nr:hypothetical protein PFISCL1PPCAC_12830 [Pristionchus fissidentatus]